MSLKLLRSSLTAEDVRRLARSEDEDTRAHAAQKICLRIADAGFSAEERAAADEILRLIANDAAVAVRRALVTTLRNSPHVPIDVARRLAADVEEIAVPMIEESPTYTEADLLALVRAGRPIQRCAVARRETVSRKVSAAIIEIGEENAVAALMRNDGAELDEELFADALAQFGGRETVTNAMIDRAELPATIAERLVALVSSEAMQRLARRHALPPQLAVELSEGARERATIDLLDQAGCATDMRRFVQQLQLNGRLTPSLIVRGLCQGHMKFFEHAMAELAGVPHGKAWVLVHDAGPLGLRAIFERTGVPGRLYAPIRAAIDIFHQLELDGTDGDRGRLAQTMIERILSRASGLNREEVDYLLEKLDAVSLEVVAQTDPDEDAVLIGA